MSDTVLVDITANMHVRLCKRVKMSKKDYERYIALCDSDTGDIESDKEIENIAQKYGFWGDIADIYDCEDPEEIEFELIPE